MMNCNVAIKEIQLKLKLMIELLEKQLINLLSSNINNSTTILHKKVKLFKMQIKIPHLKACSLKKCIKTLKFKKQLLLLNNN
jgi:hypothetical protein